MYDEFAWTGEMKVGRIGGRKEKKMNPEEYRKKLQDPRWQRKRLEIFERDEWTCQECGATDKPLHVHHLEYHRCQPWEYHESKLVTLCEDCHAEEHEKGNQEATEEPDENDEIVTFEKTPITLFLNLIGAIAVIASVVIEAKRNPEGFNWNVPLAVFLTFGVLGAITITIEKRRYEERQKKKKR